MPPSPGTRAQFFLYAAGFIVCSTAHAFMQEQLFHIPGYKFGWFLTMCDTLFYIGCALAMRAQFRFRLSSSSSSGEGGLLGNLVSGEAESKSSVPFRVYLVLALSMLASNGLGNASLAYLNYPTKVIIRSCKLIPVMAAGFFILRKRFSLLEYGSALSLIFGTVMFTLADVSVSPSFEPLGVFLCSASVMFDALFSNMQEQVLQRYHASLADMMLQSNAICFAAVLVLVLLTGELFAGIRLAFRVWYLVPVILSISLLGYLSLLFYTPLIRHFSVVIALSVASVRKVITILLSFLLFPKPMSSAYAVAGVFVTAGIALNIHAKQQAYAQQRRAADKFDDPESAYDV